jgi:multidrug efflux pump subunit AcrA (membrane-fusion protein)
MWKLTRIAAPLLVLVVATGAGWWIYSSQQAAQGPAEEAHAEDEHAGHEHNDEEHANEVHLTVQGRKNLGLVVAPLKPTTFTRSLEIPGVIQDRPGVSDRSVVSPATGVVTQIHAYPGETVAPNAPLFTVRMVSESLHASQLELFKATREIEIAQAQKRRLEDAGAAIARSQIIDLENQIRRFEVLVQAHRQDLQSRGLAAETIAAIARGKFLTEIEVRAPSEEPEVRDVALVSAIQEAEPPFSFEMQELKIELGQQVELGQVLCSLADHRVLMIEGRGFKGDMPLVQGAARDGRNIEVEYDEPDASVWTDAPGKLQIHHLANTIDPESRTFAFYLQLPNQWHAYERDGETRLLWRFRPGDRVRLHVPEAEMTNVFVAPRDSVARDGAEAYVFQLKDGAFIRRAVHVLYEDRRHAVIANDGAVREFAYIAQSGAATLNRILKSQASKDAPSGIHVHADGTVHGQH